MKTPEQYLQIFWNLLEGLPQFNSSQPISQRFSASRIFTDSATQFGTRATNHSFYLLQPFTSELESLSEIDECLEGLAQAGFITTPGLRNDQGQPVEDKAAVKRHQINHALRLLSMAVDRVGHFRLSPTEIAALASELESKMKQCHQRWMTVPLKNFTMGGSPFPIDGLELNAFTGEEKTVLWERGSLDYTMPAEEFARAKIRIMGRFNDGVTNERQHVVSSVDCLIDSLRLFKEGDIGTLGAFDHAEPMPGSTQQFGFDEMPDHRAKSFGETYELHDSDRTALTALFNSIQSLRKAGSLRHLEVGIRRFNQSYGRQTPEDAIIDWAVALENTLLSNLKEELSYRLSLRGAALLHSIKNPADTKKHLQVLYKIRSLIAHTGMLIFDNEVQKEIAKICQPDFFLKETQQLVRLILREYVTRMEKGLSVAQITDGLETQIVQGLAVTQQIPSST